MPRSKGPVFTSAEAAVLTNLPVKAVHNAIDRKIVPTVANDPTAGTGRLVDLRGLMILSLERRLGDRMAPALRQQLAAALSSQSRETVSVEDGFLTIRLDQPRRELAAALRVLRRARQLVITDPEVMGGEPVFRGTRVPVYLIASLVAGGATNETILEGYPRLTTAMIEIALIYAAAYPQRGRPRANAWDDRAPVSRSRRSLAAIPAG